ncbi:unnamed protein product, partial [Tetraodon nigroviridis]
MGGPMRMNPPRGMAMGPQVRTPAPGALGTLSSSGTECTFRTNYGGMRPPPNSMGGPMPGMNMGPGGRGPWPGPNTNSIAYSSSSPGNYVGPPGGGGPPGTPIMPSPGDSTNSSENIYTMMNPIGPGGNRPNFPMGPGSRWANGSHGSHGAPPHERITRWVDLPRDAPETGGIPQTKLTLAVLFLLRVWGHGRVAKGEYRSRFGGVFSISSTCSDSHRSCVLPPQSSPNNMGGMNNPPGTPRDDGEMGGNFLNPFQSESVSR